MKAKEEEERLIREKENDMIKTRIYCCHPVSKEMLNLTTMLLIDDDLGSIVKDCLERFDLKDMIAPEDCRLVSYNKHQDTIICSFDSDALRLCDVTSRFNICYTDYFLEIKEPG